MRKNTRMLTYFISGSNLRSEQLPVIIRMVSMSATLLYNVDNQLIITYYFLSSQIVLFSSFYSSCKPLFTLFFFILLTHSSYNKLHWC